MRGDEAMKKCPDIKLVSVPEVRGKADLTRFVRFNIVDQVLKTTTLNYLRRIAQIP